MEKNRSKKAQKNPFYFFMLQFRSDSKAEGKYYRNFAEVAVDAGFIWKNMSMKEREKYNEEAIQFKNQSKLNKKNSLGQYLVDVEKEEQEAFEAEEDERYNIRTLVKKLCAKHKIVDADFYIMDVNEFCNMNGIVLIGEFSILRLSIRDGIKEIYHELVHPGKIPLGYDTEVKYYSNEYSLEWPNQFEKGSDYAKIYKNFLKFLNVKKEWTGAVPYIFTMVGREILVKTFLAQLCKKAGVESSFEVYKVDCLLYTLIKNIKTSEDEGYPSEFWTRVFMERHEFYITKGCQHHNEADRITVCTTSRVRQFAFAMLDCCCPIVAVDPVPGKHLPDFNPDLIKKLVELSKERAGLVAHPNRGDPSTFDYKRSPLSSSCESLSDNSSQQLAPSVNDDEPVNEESSYKEEIAESVSGSTVCSSIGSTFLRRKLEIYNQSLKNHTKASC